MRISRICDQGRHVSSRFSSRKGVRSVPRSAFRAGAWLGAATLATTAVAQDRMATHAEAASGNAVLDTIEVSAQRLGNGLDALYTAPLLETPQTITLVPREVIDQQNLLTMREILSTLPGITF